MTQEECRDIEHAGIRKAKAHLEFNLASEVQQEDLLQVHEQQKEIKDKYEPAAECDKEPDVSGHVQDWDTQCPFTLIFTYLICLRVSQAPVSCGRV